MLTFEEIKELIEMVAKNRLEGVSLERAGFRLEISGVSAPAPAAAAPVVVSGAPVPAAAVPLPSAAPQPEEEARPEGHVVTSPIVGTFYAAPSPDAEPYARIGDRVKKGQVLCIVEAMKLMNEIESDVDGEIVEIIPKNAQPVEFGEPLYVIRTA